MWRIGFYYEITEDAFFIGLWGEWEVGSKYAIYVSFLKWSFGFGVEFL